MAETNSWNQGIQQKVFKFINLKYDIYLEIWIKSKNPIKSNYLDIFSATW